MNTTAQDKKEYIQAYKWHIQAFDYLLFSGATVLTTAERNNIIKAQQLLDNAVTATADKLYNNEEDK